MRLRNMYYVKNLDTGQEGASVMITEDQPQLFVLSPDKDPAALAALMTYAEFCEPELATDIEQWVEAIKKRVSGREAILGSVGAANARHLMVQKVEEQEMGEEARKNTVDLAVNLRKGDTWPSLRFLLG